MASEYPQTGSRIDDDTVRTGLSTQMVVKFDHATVGALQELAINQTRDIARWEEIGTDGIVDSHPRHAAQVNLSATRIVFDGLRLPEAFGRGFVNLQAQRFPFDIHIIDRSGGEGEFSIVHTYHNCWFNRYSTPYSAGNYIISEGADIWCEFVTSMQNGKNVAIGGASGITVESDSVERSTDLLGQRGSLDSAGLRTMQT